MNEQETPLQVNITYPKLPRVSGFTAGVTFLLAMSIICGIPFKMVDFNIEAVVSICLLVAAAGVLGWIDSINQQHDKKNG